MATEVIARLNGTDQTSLEVGGVCASLEVERLIDEQRPRFRRALRSVLARKSGRGGRSGVGRAKKLIPAVAERGRGRPEVPIT